MIYKYSTSSNTKLLTCHKDLQIIFNDVIEYIDCSILTGYRSEIDQTNAFKNGKSMLTFPLSKHNKTPSMAVDVAPYPIDWKDYKRFYYFGGFVKAIAFKLLENKLINHRIRWGGDWNNDNDFSDQKFNDLVHFELLEVNK